MLEGEVAFKLDAGNYLAKASSMVKIEKTIMAAASNKLPLGLRVYETIGKGSLLESPGYPLQYL